MASIQTTRFGKIEIEEDKIIHFPQGLLGFPMQKHYILFEHKPHSPFFWLQSVDRPDLAFVLTNPFLVEKDYLKDVMEAEESLFQAVSGGQVSIFVLVTIPPGKVKDMTVNLIGPLVIEVDNRLGRQIVLPNSGYSHQHPLVLG